MKGIYYFTAGLILGITLILFYQSCKKQPIKIKYIDKVKYRDSLRIDTIINKTDKFIKEKIYLHDTILDTIRIKKIITKYFAKNIYVDTAFNSDTLFLSIKDTIFKNEIQDRKIKITVNRLPKRQYNYFILGPYLRGNQKNVNIGLNLAYERQKNVFGVGIDKNNLMFSYGRKIRLKK